MPADFAPALAEATGAFLEAAEARAEMHLTLLDAPLPSPLSGTLVFEWIVAHQRGVEQTPLGEVDGTLAAEVRALYAVLNRAGASVTGRLLIRTFDADA